MKFLIVFVAGLVTLASAQNCFKDVNDSCDKASKLKIIIDILYTKIRSFILK